MESLKVKAKNKKQALDRAIEEFPEQLASEISRSDLGIELLEEHRGFLGFGGKNLYRVFVKEAELESDKLEDLTRDIAIDGDFQISVADDGIFIRVTPPEGEGEAVHYQEIKQALEDKEIVEVDWEKVQETIHEQAEEWVKIAPRKPELDRDADAEIEVTEDGLKAYLKYIPALGGEDFTVEGLKNFLREEGVVYGIDEEKLEDVIETGEAQEHLLIAEGDQPEPGQDAELEYHFQLEKDSVGTTREDGSIDFFDLGLINNVEQGEVLVTKHDPQPGQPGKSVTGEEIPPPQPKDVDLPAGKNTEKKDEKTLVAEIEGQVVKEKTKIKVLPVHEVKGNVDLNTGNIDFVGNVIVRGDVTEGFEVKAEGNVEVRGNVSAAVIESGGEVVIKKGFIGKEKGRIEAEGDIQVKFIENGVVRTRGSVYVQDAIMHSYVSAGERVEVTLKKGHLVGGRIRAAREIEANIIGSSLATTTELEAGIDPECRQRINELEEETENMNNNLLKTKKALNILEKIKDKKGSLPRNKETMYYRLLSTRKKLEKALEDNKKEMKQLQEQIKNLSRGRVKVHSKVYPGTRISIGKSCYNVQDELSSTAFIEEKGEVRQVTL